MSSLGLCEDHSYLSVKVRTVSRGSSPTWVWVKKRFDEKSSPVTRLLKKAAASEFFAPLLLHGNLPKAGNSLVLHLL